MARYRYRTATLVGPWRDSRLKAECDAVAVGQARFEPRDGTFAWNVAGEIEVGDGEVRNGARSAEAQD
jgi:hypothetical protein